MELLIRLIVWLVREIRSVIDNVQSDLTYRTGFTAGLLFALFIGWLGNTLLYWWNRVLQFFGPTAVPAVNPGPSPMDRLLTAIGSFLSLVVVIFFLVVIFALVVAGPN